MLDTLQSYIEQDLYFVGPLKVVIARLQLNCSRLLLAHFESYPRLSDMDSHSSLFGFPSRDTY